MYGIDYLTQIRLSQKVDELKDKRKKALDAKASSTKRLIATESKFKNLPKVSHLYPRVVLMLL